MGSIVLPHLRTAWHVDQAILSEEERLVVIRFGRDHDRECIQQDEVLYKIAERVKNFAVIYLCDVDEVPDFNTMYELYDPMTIMFFYRNKHMMCDFGTGNNNKLNWVLEDKQELIDIIETIYKGAKKGRGLVISPKVKPVLDNVTTEILAQKQEVARLNAVANKHPFYKYNGVWSRELQNLVTSIELCSWLGGLQEYKAGSFMTIEEVGKFLEIPVNLKEQDAFHLTIEEYLLALIAMVEELSRLAVNSVTLGDYTRPLQIANFIKDLFAGFQLLNLKNDILRKRSDGIKYSLKKVEDVVYDLSLRNLIPKGSGVA
ncbi:uncharacterized protein PFLUO_LOCUS4572 [Penicillium psychrofluorescens]|uniref:uncharacterized protein n=1 Tax=Penicillium psychrofluorescens TaxID=3158075 RepID=UPI003CCE13EE